MTEPKFGWNFETTYRQLPEVFYAAATPTSVVAPKLLLFNDALARELGLDPEAFRTVEGAQSLSGVMMPPNARPLAQAYAGHQFGNFTMLGDGRAHLLGEHLTPRGERVDIALKGSGPTQYSRRGDGRAALGPMLREYVISEAMHALGIPTTRSLAVVATGELVRRETPVPGAVLTRVARSHLRVGTFEYAAALRQPVILRALADYAIQRHDPSVANVPEPHLGFLKAVTERQAALIAQWMHVGFIHGVMNTDNMSIAGETIDYGPCAFMDTYSPSTVFSSIDHQGRYAYGNQPGIAQWNLARLAECLLPLIDENEAKAIEKAEAVLEEFGASFQRHWLDGMRAKLGLGKPHADDFKFIGALLELMEKHHADYTNTFLDLIADPRPNQTLFKDEAFLVWEKEWLSRSPSKDLARKSNPVVIPRNHLVEDALHAAVAHGDLALLEQLIHVLRTPFEETVDRRFREPAPAGQGDYRTFCGT